MTYLLWLIFEIGCKGTKKRRRYNRKGQNLQILTFSVLKDTQIRSPKSWVTHKNPLLKEPFLWLFSGRGSGYP